MSIESVLDKIAEALDVDTLRERSLGFYYGEFGLSAAQAKEQLMEQQLDDICDRLKTLVATKGKEEYDGLKKQIHALEHLATCYSEQIDWDNDARKETAKEIFNKIKGKVISEHTDDGYDYEAVDLWDIEDIFKEYGVEVDG